MSYIINQHFLSQFMIKKWIITGNTYKVYNKINNSFSDISLKNKDKDVFSENEFYENKNHLPNDIENKLSEMEGEIAKVFQKILYLEKLYKSLHLTRKDLKIIRLYYILQMIRSKTSLIKSESLDGDYLFNKNNENKTSEQIKNELIFEIDFLYNKIFKLIIKDKFIDLSELGQMKKGTAGYFYFKITTFKFLNFCRIPKSFNTRFVISDSQAVQMVDPIWSESILDFMPISPTVSIVFVTTIPPIIPNIERQELDNFTKKILNLGFKLAEENFGYLLTNRNIRNKYVKKESKNYNDIYIYQFIDLDSEDTVSTINGLMYSQSIDNILCTTEQDINDLKIQIVEKGIYRIEEKNR